MPWIGLKYVVVILSDHTCLRFNGSVYQSLILITKDQTRPHICAVSPEPLKIPLKRWDINEGSAIFYRPVQDSLVLVAYASSEGSGETAHLRSLDRAFENRAKKMGYR